MLVISLCIIKSSDPNGVRVELKAGKETYKTTDSSDHFWNQDFTFALGPKDSASLSLYSNNGTRIGKRTVTLSKLYEKQVVPGSAESIFKHRFKVGQGKLTCKITIRWPYELSFLWPSDKRRWLDSEIVRIPTVEELEQRFQSAAIRLKKKHCHDFFIDKLRYLQGWDFVMICDDSGSMNTATDQGSRWAELLMNTKRTVKICTLLDPDGMSVNFLNRKGSKNVTNFEQVKSLFRKGPSGSTPLGAALEKALQEKTLGKPMVILVATDGTPDDPQHLMSVLRSRFPHMYDVYVTFIACTDNKNDVAWMNDLDKSEPNVDVLDDYKSEREEVWKAQGRQVDYTKGDHIARMLCGPVFAEIDNLDQLVF